MIFDLIAGSGGSNLWTPLDLYKNGEEGFWLDGSDPTIMFQDTALTTAVTTSGDPVAAWLNKVTGYSSSNLHKLTQATTSYRPQYNVTGGVGGISYDGVDDKLGFYFSDSDINVSNGITYAIGFKFPHANKSKIIIDAAPDFYLATRGTDNLFDTTLIGKSIRSSNTYSTSGYNVAVGHAKNPTGYPTINFNGTTATGSTYPTGTGVLLRDELVSPDFLDSMTISQFVLINRLLTAAELSNLTAFVNSKSGL